ncbi:sporulation protein YunB [Salipaludibacillus aurantiacus]|uniref:Sporulation protein YunB n=1 Tax=Salipaludibacillus aurantiacus TaxID=1601833 RepID=A0A1H9WX00_9BACI|nr:sporulation protein YunB [Salipaludibacillus aurantiacus]SES37933.1 sporulation protein YunB [Salipaludibacillus aurantiacus]
MKAFRTVRPSRKKKGPLPFKYVFMISLLIFVILTIQGLIVVEKGVRPTLIAIAKTETQRIGTLAINDAISRHILEDTDMEDLVEFERDENGKVMFVQYNPVIYNRVLQETTKRVQNYLNDIEHGRVKDIRIPNKVDVEREGATFSEDGIIHMIPLGQATNNALLAHLGPRVPVRLSAIGDVKSQLKENIVHVGINNTYMSVSVDIEVDVKVVIPFATETEVVRTSIPVAMVWIPGEVPDFYGGQGGEGGMTPAMIQRPKEFEEDFSVE